MIKTLMLEDLDCAHCAGLIEEEVNELDEVEEAVVSFLTQKMEITIDEEKYDDAFLAKVKKIVASHEPDVNVIEE